MTTNSLRFLAAHVDSVYTDHVAQHAIRPDSVGSNGSGRALCGRRVWASRPIHQRPFNPEAGWVDPPCKRCAKIAAAAEHTAQVVADAKRTLAEPAPAAEDGRDIIARKLHRVAATADGLTMRQINTLSDAFEILAARPDLAAAVVAALQPEPAADAGELAEWEQALTQPDDEPSPDGIASAEYHASEAARRAAEGSAAPYQERPEPERFLSGHSRPSITGFGATRATVGHAVALESLSGSSIFAPALCGREVIVSRTIAFEESDREPCKRCQRAVNQRLAAAR